MSRFSHTRVLPMAPYVIVNPSLAAKYLREGRTLVCIIRHGQTDWNAIKRLQGRENVPLNEVGLAQAAEVANIIKRTHEAGVSYGAVCTSPLSRAYDTAKCISDCISVSSPTVLESLIERDYGSLAGLTLEERRKLFPGGEKQAGNVESVPQAASRMMRAIDDMLDASGGQTVIGVTHGGIINAAFSRLTSGEFGTGKTLTVNCSISCIAAGIAEPIPLAYNLQNEGAVNYISKLVMNGAEI